MTTKIIAPVKPVDEVLPGSMWIWQADMRTRSGLVIRAGMMATVTARTPETPHGEVMERGYNLIVTTGGGTTVWSTFEQCISRGMLKPVGPEKPRRTAWERLLGDEDE